MFIYSYKLTIEDFVTDYAKVCEAANGKKQAQVIWATHVQDGYAG